MPDETLASPSVQLEMHFPEEDRTDRKNKKKRSKDIANDVNAREGEYAETVFLYGVAVFYGLSEEQERGILEDVEHAGLMRRKFVKDDWEIEECHYIHGPNIAHPRIFDDFFSVPYALFFASLISDSATAFKTRRHLLKLSVAHALAQSTLLAYYETHAER
ncbi:uncharacterized protein LAESUDRAFT_320505 [Laetiporus sulphureus 93-53]|uniref:DUF155 domain-containing protein n=1 Tax=Laetiporus sulphureus 93-53 TaxID=1314785 RepID=A0A165D1F0_9APHY|nr:uncharacterized protein LAESUDRAFT_320505 [Laetiporus sulphureus 93-53]KZT03953.1 hypothetical protein LAESUDRAFT_320505 [Laetiporus sulphureus 93-53]